MKLMILSIMALGLITTIPAGAQSVPPGLDDRPANNLPRTRQEQELDLEGQPPGRIEQPSPDVDEFGAPEVDDDTDIVPGVRPSSPRRF
ncbi:MAG: hypothetical protein K2Y56_05115 [Methylobacterium sp.]|uniref:hypothetical protein n=1 Tax=Methylobacterium sp. TaxID=409 RepID=UPI0025CF58A7|nr:hypothetical protein [Methylobacterium sp.]MBX9930904.1 hypothetical protein [Methylobacterium sp.]